MKDLVPYYKNNMIRILKAQLVLVMEIGDFALIMEILFYVSRLEKNKHM